MMTYEVEMKFRVADLESLAEKARAIGAAFHQTVEQEDRYLAHPSRNFAETGEALRLRRDGETNKVTYKGPKLGGPAKTREEIELPFGEGAADLASLGRLFELLGFTPVAVVRKDRSEAEIEVDGRGLKVALDRVDGLGDFAEVETIARGAEDLAAAQASVQSLATRLGLVDLETRSYLRMLLEARGAGAGLP
jgi:adenylate cyclase class 2